MKKLICSVSFYLAATLDVMLICSNNYNHVFFGAILLLILYFFCNALGKDVMYELMGINWLQKQFKNNPVIQDMTKE